MTFGGGALATKPPIATTVKFQYYQSDDVMTVSVLHKQAKPEETLIEISEERLKVVVTKDAERMVVIDKKLFDKVVPAQCKAKFKPTMIDVKLKKKTPGISWHELEGVGGDDDEKKRRKAAGGGAAGGAATSKTQVDAALADAQGEVNRASSACAALGAGAAVARPYASHRDWDQIDKELEEELNADKPEGEEALNKLFQDIYGKATRRRGAR